MRTFFGSNVLDISCTIYILETLQQLASRGSLSPSPVILVVEDYPELNRIIVQHLSRFGQVASAFDGVEALRLAHDLRPDIIVTDLMMPEGDGDELIRALRNDPTFENTPIIVVTAVADQDRRLDLFRAGAVDYILKPFSLEELSIRVRNAVSAAHARALLRDALSSRATELESLASALVNKTRHLETKALPGLASILERIEALAAELSLTEDLATKEKAQRLADLVREARDVGTRQSIAP